MEEIEKIQNHLVDYYNELITSKQIYDVGSIDVKCKLSGDYRDNDTAEKKKFHNTMYSVDISFYITKGFQGVYLHTSNHDSLFKCVKEVKFRTENEIKLQKDLADFKEKLASEPFDELSFLKHEFDKAVEDEAYEKAEELKKKISKLEKKQKTKKK